MGDVFAYHFFCLPANEYSTQMPIDKNRPTIVKLTKYAEQFISQQRGEL